MLLQILMGAAMVGTAGFFAWDRYTMNVARIEGALLGQRATDIRVTANWFAYDRHSRTYDVTYTDRSGTRQRRQCRITSLPLFDDELFWSPPLT